MIYRRQISQSQSSLHTDKASTFRLAATYDKVNEVNLTRPGENNA